MEKIETLQSLVEQSTNRSFECFISLAGGLARSSKNIYYNRETKVFEVLHEIDGTTEFLNHEDLLKSNIGVALERGALYAY